MHNSSEVLKLLIIIIITTLAASRVVNRGNDWVANFLQILHLFLDGVLIGVLAVGVEPVLGLGEAVLDRRLVVLANLIGELVLVLNRVAHCVDVVLEGVLRVDALLDQLILVSELLRIGDHLFDLFLGQAALIVRDRNGLRLAHALLDAGDS